MPPRLNGGLDRLHQPHTPSYFNTGATCTWFNRACPRVRLQHDAFFVSLRNPRNFCRCSSWCCNASFRRFIQGLVAARLANNHMSSVHTCVRHRVLKSLGVSSSWTRLIPRESRGQGNTSWRRTQQVPGKASQLCKVCVLVRASLCVFSSAGSCFLLLLLLWGLYAFGPLRQMCRAYLRVRSLRFFCL